MSTREEQWERLALEAIDKGTSIATIDDVRLIAFGDWRYAELVADGKRFPCGYRMFDKLTGRWVAIYRAEAIE